ncbi:transglutaminase-like putative cysteine protease [Thermobifida halotolerans]|uniref:transglutaminase family protein n=1 Tax=Thermobifida halotolerans TaxID=483545 RepID=UPI001FB377E2|nr:DUF3488 and transglutaminase-like domain-containing protein [Thermobifida halotolerans]
MRSSTDALARTLLSLATAVHALCALPLLGPVFGDAEWWTGPVTAVAAIAAVGAAAQWTRVPATVTSVLQLVALVMAVTGRYAPDAALLRTVPTPAAVARLVDLLFAGVSDIRTNVIPVPATDGIVLLVTLLLGVLLVSAHLMAVTLRVPGLAGAALLSLVAVPLTVHPRGVGGGAFAVAAAGFLLLLAVDSAARTASWGVRVPPRDRRGGRRWTAAASALRGLGAVGIAGTSVVLALLVPALVPTMTSDSVFSLVGQLRGDGQTVTTVDPLTSLRGTLTSGGDRRVLEYRTADRSPEYLRTHVLDAFDGENWTMSPVRADAGDRVEGPLPRVPGFAGEAAPGTVTTDVTVSADARGMDFLPLPYPSSTVRVAGEWYVDPDTLMVFSPHGEAAGLTYRVTSGFPEPREEDLRAAAPSAPGIDRRYLAPPSLSEEVTRLVEQVVADADTSFDRAVALQDWFTGGGFDYDLNPPRVPGGTDPLAHFLLQSRTGYCQHFASAMAATARHLGIPARVAVGYTPGEHVGSDRWVVRESDAHAWPELYFEGYGWLRFEPTPGEGQPTAAVPDYATPGPAEPTAADADGAEESVESAAPESAPPDEGAAAEQNPAPEERPTADGPAGDGVPGAVAAVSALTVLSAVPALLRHLVRGLRWRRARDAASLARSAWLELRDDLLDLGRPWNPAHSPRAVERALVEDGRLDADARAALHRVVAAVEAVHYAPGPFTVPHLAGDSRTVRRALTAASPPLSRVLALLLPRSLWWAARTAEPRRVRRP